MGWLTSQPMTFPWFQLLRGCCFLLLCPAPFNGLGNALPSFRRKISLLLLDGFLCGWRCRGLLRRWGGSAPQQGARLLQLGDLLIDLCKNFRDSHGSSCWMYICDPIPLCQSRQYR